LGELLVARGKLTNEQLQKALQAQMIWGGHLGTNLIELGYIDEDELGEILAEAHAVQYAPYDMLQEIPSSVLTSIPRGLVEKYKLIPFRFDGKKLHLVMLQPQDLTALDEVSFATGFQLVPYVTPEIRLFQILEKYYNIPRARRYITLTKEMSLRGRRRGSPGPDSIPGRARPAASILDAPEAPPDRPPVPPSPGEEGDDAWTAEDGAFAGGEDPYRVSPAMDWSPSTSGSGSRGEPAAPAQEDTPAEIEPGPVEPAERTDPGRDPVLDGLLKARTLNGICRILVEEAAGTFRRCVVFARDGDALVSVTGLSTSSDAWSIDGRALPFDLVAVEALFSEGRTYYLGPPPGGSEERAFYESLGGPPPPNAFLAPVRLQEKIALVFYGDQIGDEIRPGEVDPVLAMMHQAGLALDLLSLRRKDSPE
ncbi:MAG TPA: hypothetical protein VNI57_10110, partial [Candidatus Saccharimonadales bacterium]|nr:hypothetical protein [Candidatus Saccharimonadales bacterium]